MGKQVCERRPVASTIHPLGKTNIQMGQTNSARWPWLLSASNVPSDKDHCVGSIRKWGDNQDFKLV